MALTKATEVILDGNYPCAHHKIGVAAGVKIYAGAVVAASNADGFAHNALGSNSALFAYGVALETVDNSVGVDGAKSVLVRAGGFVMFAPSAFPGQKMYLTDENTFTATATTNTRNAGVVTAISLSGASVLSDLRAGQVAIIIDGTRVV